MTHLKTKIVALTDDGLRCLPLDKTVVYTIKDKNGTSLFTGVASRGRVSTRIKEHLPDGSMPLVGGITAQILQQETVAAAMKTASEIVRSDRPRCGRVTRGGSVSVTRNNG